MTFEKGTEITFRIIDNNDISPEFDQKIRDGLVECFPKDTAHYSQNRVWHYSTPAWVILALTKDEEIAAHIAIVERTVTAGKSCAAGESGENVIIAGPGGVFVRKKWQKTGLSDRIMQRVLEESRRRGYDAGLLFCKEVLAGKVYGRMGWQKVDGTTFMNDADDKRIPRPDKDITMTIPISLDSFPAGDIDLNGPDW
jgi:GNAT superfamily N-acetyltransferase